MSQPDPIEAAAAARHDERVAEYGKWVAKDAIFIGGARAYNPGDPVPASVVGNAVSEQQVTAVTSSASTKKG